MPLLVDEGFAVCDTLAIVEYLAERHPEIAVWPQHARQRARARSLCAEMHAGFTALRNRFPMNVEASLPEVGERWLRDDAGVAADLQRIETMWATQLAESGGPFLFGEFGAVDAYFAPVCSRIRTYSPLVDKATGGYVDRIHHLPAMRAWCDAARAEQDFIAEDEPYRSGR